MIYRITGFLLLIETAMLLCCGGVSLLYHEDDLISFLQSASLTALMGVVLLFIGRGAEKQLGRRDGYVIVTVAWLAFSLFGMLPFYLSGYIPSITNAFFETMSGFSSTGATILNDIEKLPHGLLFWRSMTQWIGGLGIVFFTIAVLPIFGVGGIQVFAAEASGPTHDTDHSINVRRNEYFRQHMPCFRNHQYRGVLYQTGQHRILSLSLYRICDLYLHVYIRYQLHLIIIVRQRKAQKICPRCRIEMVFLVRDRFYDSNCRYSLL